MASYTGTNGVVKIGANAVAEVRSFTLNRQVETTDDTVMGDTARSSKNLFVNWDGQVECYWDPDDAGQSAIQEGDEVTLALYPTGENTGDTFFSGTALVTGVNLTQSFDSMIEASFSFASRGGAITESTVPA